MSASKSSQVSDNALKILEKRYFLKDDNGKLIERTPDEMFARVADAVAKAEVKFGKPELVSVMRDKFFEMMSSLRWMPNTPTLVNAGRDRGQLAACYVIPTSDSMEGIMDTIKNQALVQKSGGGTGFDFGPIRERGALVKSTGHKAAGPVPVIKLMNYMMSEFITQGGIRDGANMGVLPDDHPDIIEFITFKHVDGSCRSFNVSVAASDAFMEAVLSNSDWDLHSRVDGHVVRTIKAKELFDMLVKFAWETGDPGMLFIDAANRSNPTPHIGKLRATNPCGEQWLLPNEACTLGHHNLGKYYYYNPNAETWDDKFDWQQYHLDISNGVRFLDNVVEINHYATPDIEKMHRYTNRKIGLGVMGFADLLVKLGVKYGSPESLEIADRIAKFHRNSADIASAALGEERGSFGSFKGSKVENEGWQTMRNACRTTVAPTGSTAIIAGCSTSIEPLYGIFLTREQAGMVMHEVHPLFQQYIDGLDTETQERVRNYYYVNKTIIGCPFIPDDVQSIFMQANDVNPTDHVMMQVAWQKHIDNAISKTINMRNSATIEDVRNAYILAWQNGAKGVTVYRDGCRQHQALSAQQGPVTTPELAASVADNTSIESSGADDALCPECNDKLEQAAGCDSCHSCGYSACHLS